MVEGKEQTTEPTAAQSIERLNLREIKELLSDGRTLGSIDINDHRVVSPYLRKDLKSLESLLKNMETRLRMALAQKGLPELEEVVVRAMHTIRTTYYLVPSEDPGAEEKDATMMPAAVFERYYTEYPVPSEESSYEGADEALEAAFVPPATRAQDPLEDLAVISDFVTLDAMIEDKIKRLKERVDDINNDMLFATTRESTLLDRKKDLLRQERAAKDLPIAEQTKIARKMQDCKHELLQISETLTLYRHEFLQIAAGTQRLREYAEILREFVRTNDYEAFDAVAEKFCGNITDNEGAFVRGQALKALQVPVVFNIEAEIQAEKCEEEFRRDRIRAKRRRTRNRIAVALGGMGLVLGAIPAGKGLLHIVKTKADQQLAERDWNNRKIHAQSAPPTQPTQSTQRDPNPLHRKNWKEWLSDSVAKYGNYERFNVLSLISHNVKVHLRSTMVTSVSGQLEMEMYEPELIFANPVTGEEFNLLEDPEMRGILFPNGETVEMMHISVNVDHNTPDVGEMGSNVSLQLNMEGKGYKYSLIDLVSRILGNIKEKVVKKDVIQLRAGVSLHLGESNTEHERGISTTSVELPIVIDLPKTMAGKLRYEFADSNTLQCYILDLGEGQKVLMTKLFLSQGLKEQLIEKNALIMTEHGAFRPESLELSMPLALDPSKPFTYLPITVISPEDGASIRLQAIVPGVDSIPVINDVNQIL